MREHLHKFLVRQAEHHATKASAHVALAKHHTALSSFHKAEDGGSAAELHAHIASEHTKMAEEHAGMGAACVECCKALQTSHKAAGMGDELMPTEVRQVIPDNPRLTAVPRFGAPGISKLDGLSPDLQKMFSLSSDDGGN